jgi:hypothetical protein
MCDRSDLENHYIEKDAEEGGLRNFRKQTELRYERLSVLKAVQRHLYEDGHDRLPKHAV